MISSRLTNDVGLVKSYLEKIKETIEKPGEIGATALESLGEMKSLLEGKLVEIKDIVREAKEEQEQTKAKRGVLTKGGVEDDFKPPEARVYVDDCKAYDSRLGSRPTGVDLKTYNDTNVYEMRPSANKDTPPDVVQCVNRSLDDGAIRATLPPAALKRHREAVMRFMQLVDHIRDHNAMNRLELERATSSGRIDDDVKTLMMYRTYTAATRPDDPARTVSVPARVLMKKGFKNRTSDAPVQTSLGACQNARTAEQCNMRTFVASGGQPACVWNGDLVAMKNIKTDISTDTWGLDDLALSANPVFESLQDLMGDTVDPSTGVARGYNAEETKDANRKAKAYGLMYKNDGSNELYLTDPTIEAPFFMLKGQQIGLKSSTAGTAKAFQAMANELDLVSSLGKEENAQPACVSKSELPYLKVPGEGVRFLRPALIEGKVMKENAISSQDSLTVETALENDQSLDGDGMPVRRAEDRDIHRINSRRTIFVDPTRKSPLGSDKIHPSVHAVYNLITNKVRQLHMELSKDKSRSNGEGFNLPTTLRTAILHIQDVISKQKAEMERRATPGIADPSANAGGRTVKVKKLSSAEFWRRLDDPSMSTFYDIKIAIYDALAQIVDLLHRNNLYFESDEVKQIVLFEDNILREVVCDGAPGDGRCNLARVYSHESPFEYRIVSADKKTARRERMRNWTPEQDHSRSVLPMVLVPKSVAAEQGLTQFVVDKHDDAPSTIRPLVDRTLLESSSVRIVGYLAEIFQRVKTSTGEYRYHNDLARVAAIMGGGQSNLTDDQKIIGMTLNQLDDIDSTAGKDFKARRQNWEQMMQRMAIFENANSRLRTTRHVISGGKFDTSTPRLHLDVNYSAVSKGSSQTIAEKLKGMPEFADDDSMYSPYFVEVPDLSDNQLRAAESFSNRETHDRTKHGITPISPLEYIIRKVQPFPDTPDILDGSVPVSDTVGGISHLYKDVAAKFNPDFKGVFNGLDMKVENSNRLVDRPTGEGAKAAATKRLVVATMMATYLPYRARELSDSDVGDMVRNMKRRLKTDVTGSALGEVFAAPYVMRMMRTHTVSDTTNFDKDKYRMMYMRSYDDSQVLNVRTNDNQRTLAIQNTLRNLSPHPEVYDAQELLEKRQKAQLRKKRDAAAAKRWMSSLSDHRSYRQQMNASLAGARSSSWRGSDSGDVATAATESDNMYENETFQGKQIERLIIPAFVPARNGRVENQYTDPFYGLNLDPMTQSPIDAFTYPMLWYLYRSFLTSERTINATNKPKMAPVQAYAINPSNSVELGPVLSEISVGMLSTVRRYVHSNTRLEILGYDVPSASDGDDAKSRKDAEKQPLIKGYGPDYGVINPRDVTAADTLVADAAIASAIDAWTYPVADVNNVELEERKAELWTQFLGTPSLASKSIFTGKNKIMIDVRGLFFDICVNLFHDRPGKDDSSEATAYAIIKRGDLELNNLKGNFLFDEDRYTSTFLSTILRGKNSEGGGLRMFQKQDVPSLACQLNQDVMYNATSGTEELMKQSGGQEIPDDGLFEAGKNNLANYKLEMTSSSLVNAAVGKPSKYNLDLGDMKSSYFPKHPTRTALSLIVPPGVSVSSKDRLKVGEDGKKMVLGESDDIGQYQGLALKPYSLDAAGTAATGHEQQCATFIYNESNASGNWTSGTMTDVSQVSAFCCEAMTKLARDGYFDVGTNETEKLGNLKKVMGIETTDGKYDQRFLHALKLMKLMDTITKERMRNDKSPLTIAIRHMSILQALRDKIEAMDKALQEDDAVTKKRTNVILDKAKLRQKRQRLMMLVRELRNSTEHLFSMHHSGGGGSMSEKLELNTLSHGLISRLKYNP